MQMHIGHECTLSTGAYSGSHRAQMRNGGRAARPHHLVHAVEAVVGRAVALLAGVKLRLLLLLAVLHALLLLLLVLARNLHTLQLDVAGDLDLAAVRGALRRELGADALDRGPDPAVPLNPLLERLSVSLSRVS